MTTYEIIFMKYTHDIIVIGAGSGGLNIASFANRVGLKVLLIDKSDKSIGGDCLNFGCVPSKALIHVAGLSHYASEMKKFGQKISGSVDLAKVAKYVDSKKEVIREHENAAYFRKKGMDVALGEASFVNSHTVAAGKKNILPKKLLLQQVPDQDF
jgi:pyruvate/2-oxoglutarate dehydrogenase complex dihydrolipoamide dehydrogenase (E3) component